MNTEPKIPQYQSLLLRLWQEQEIGQATWHGEVESIQTGRKWQFTDLESLFNFLRVRTSGELTQESGQKKKGD